jgi:SAM-dependent methyltransferase
MNPPDPFGGHYYDWRIRRLRLLFRHFDPAALAGKTVLEVGCGFGDLGAHFLALGADMTFADARQEHLDVVATRYPQARRARFDAAEPFPFADSRFDIVLHLGLLYHLPPTAVRGALAEACRVGREICIETIVSDSDDPTYCPATVEEGYDQAFVGTGSRPSPALVESCLTAAQCTWRRFDDPALNSGVHRYDWQPKHNGDYDATYTGGRWGHRRFWIGSKSSPSYFGTQ